MKNIPERIYLQIDADGETPENFNELHGVSWCSDKINDNDIEYVLASSARAKEKDILKLFIDWYTELFIDEVKNTSNDQLFSIFIKSFNI